MAHCKITTTGAEFKKNFPGEYSMCTVGKRIIYNDSPFDVSGENFVEIKEGLNSTSHEFDITFADPHGFFRVVKKTKWYYDGTHCCYNCNDTFWDVTIPDDATVSYHPHTFYLQLDKMILAKPEKMFTDDRTIDALKYGSHILKSGTTENVEWTQGLVNRVVSECPNEIMCVPEQFRTSDVYFTLIKSDPKWICFVPDSKVTQEMFDVVLNVSPKSFLRCWAFGENMFGFITNNYPIVSQYITQKSLTNKQREIVKKL